MLEAEPPAGGRETASITGKASAEPVFRVASICLESLRCPGRSGRVLTLHHIRERNRRCTVLLVPTVI
jgi:hypothetical protein